MTKKPEIVEYRGDHPALLWSAHYVVVSRQGDKIIATDWEGRRVWFYESEAFAVVARCVCDTCCQADKLHAAAVA